MELEKIRKFLDDFTASRGWKKYRTPKNLCMALSVEVAELNEIFQWLDTEESKNVKNDQKTMQAIREEMADVLSYLLQISSVLDIDIYEAFWEKIKKTELKYPLEKAMHD